jgi:hypothetical protein
MAALAGPQQQVQLMCEAVCLRLLVMVVGAVGRSHKPAALISKAATMLRSTAQ